MRPTVLSIAGSDPSGGAGIQADLMTFAVLGVNGCAALTALTAQNARAFYGVMSVPASFVRQQLEAVFDSVSVDAVKIGMLGGVAVVRVVAGFLRDRRLPVILDPVLRASVGAALLEVDAVDVFRRELLPLATVITPNTSEAGALLGQPAPRDLAAMGAAAVALTTLGPSWALVTGGHVEVAGDCVDLLSDGKTVVENRVPRVPGERHGSGCVLSSAIAAFLALGRTVPDACALAQRFVAASIADDLVALPRDQLQEAL